MYVEGTVTVFMVLLTIKTNGKEEGARWSYLG